MPSNIKRVLKFAWIDFSRNRGNNFAAIFVLVIPILMASFLFLFQGISQVIVTQIRAKMDVTAFFVDEATEDSILEVKSALSKNFQSIIQISYVSKEQAMRDFLALHKDNSDFQAALQEIGTNPFPASLNIVTDQPDQYKKIADFLQNGNYKDIISKVDYSEKKDTINRFFAITSNINKFGLILSAILFLIAIIVVLNTIKLSVDNSKEEISTMRLVGASNWFVRGPFVVQGIICGFIAFLICLFVVGGFAYFVGPKLVLMIPGLDLYKYFIQNIWEILLIQIGFGVGLGALASYVLVRSYLKI